jgi:hypothetical protein
MRINKYQPRFFVVVKNKKYLTGSSYASPCHIGHSYYWSKDINDAQRFRISHSDADHFANQTNGKVKQIELDKIMVTTNIDFLIKITKEKAEIEGLDSDAEITTEEYLDLLLDLKMLLEKN